MQVWVIGRGVPNPQNKMLGSFELEQAQALKKSGIKVIYLAFSVRSARNLNNLGFKIINNDGIPIYSFNFPVGRILPQSITDIVFEKSFELLSKKIIQKHGQPDIIHVHYPSQRPYKVFEVLQKLGIRIVATEHWTRVQEKKINTISLKHLNSFCKHCDAFICVSSCLKQSVQELTGLNRKIYIVPNLVNANFCSSPLLQKDKFRYLVSGRLVAVKQVDKVIQAFMKVFSKYEKVALTIAGGGEEYEYLNSLICKEGRESQIHLLGSVSREKMAEIMASTDVLVTYSRLETFCVPVIEAWMCGKPVIASDLIPVIVDNNDSRLGMTVDQTRIVTLENALIEMRRHWNDFDSKWIENYANTHFSEMAISQMLINIYNFILLN